MSLRRATSFLCLATLAVGAAPAGAGDAIRLEAASRSFGDVTLAFPAITYRPPPAGPVHATHAAVVAEATGVAIDPSTDLLMDAANRLLFRHPDDPSVLLKIYKADVATPERIAKSLQRELALQAFMLEHDIPIAPVEAESRMLERGVVRQRFIDGEGMDARHPHGYVRGGDRRVDALLATIEAYDEAVKLLVRRQLALTFRNAVDCGPVRSLGFDLGRCYANVFLRRPDDAPILIDW